MDLTGVRGLGGLTPDALGDLTEVMSLLRRAVVALDQICDDELPGAICDSAMGLEEASHSVHLALIALEQSDPFEPAFEISRTDAVGHRLVRTATRERVSGCKAQPLNKRLVQVHR